jgi:ATP-dependent protease HslVU (ClpYQ) peptidase subunit
MRNSQGNVQMHGTAVLWVRKDNKAELIGGGQVAIGGHVMKHTARNNVIAGFAAEADPPSVIPSANR